MTQSKPIFALVDGNSFYASCQIAFDPSLQNRPVVVLSNNDGCVVAANKIAKALNQELLAKVGHLGSGGYHAARPTNMMFQPYFKVKWVLDKHNAAVFSSNYELYGDMSNRMHNILGEMAPRQEVYSIDESFLELTGIRDNLTAYGQRIKQRVQQDIGIPVAVGIGHSKTLAKLANHLAKQSSAYDGVLDLTTLPNAALDALLHRIDIGNIWGIGKALEGRLKKDGIHTAKALKYADIKTIRKKYSIVVERTVRELNGESCLSLETVAADKKQIISSRSFGHALSDYDLVEQAVVNYTMRAAEKLRRQHSVCQYLSVFIRTNPFQDIAQYRQSYTISLIYPSDNSILLSKLSRRALRKIWQPQFAYHKAGVILSEVSPKGALQTDLFAENPMYSGNPKQDALMQVMDQLNRNYGRSRIFLGAQGIPEKNQWQMKRNLMSPRYTTRWEELKTVM